MRTIDTKKYVVAFLITAVIFFSALYLANWLGQKKIDELRSIQDQISTNILSSEVQTALLQEFSCKEVGPTAVSAELGTLGDKLSYAEQTRNTNDSQVIALKQYYSLLEIKDFLLMRQVSQKCGTKYVFVLYFYGKDCTDCEKQGYVLTRLREDYPQLRVYSFDYNLDIAAIKTLISINKIKNIFPALLIDDNAYYGFQSIDDINKIIPQLAIWQREKDRLQKATATSTNSSAH